MSPQTFPVTASDTGRDDPPTFPQTPSEALQCVLDLKVGMDRLHERVKRGEKWGPVGELIAADPDWLDWRYFADRLEPYWWGESTAALVTAASASYPLDEETERRLYRDELGKLHFVADGGAAAVPSYLPKIVRGVHLFSRPCLTIEMNGVHRLLSGIGWTVGISRTHGMRLSIRGIAWYPPVALATWWADGGSVSLDDDTVDGTFRRERIEFTKWICTAAMFVEQELVTTTPTAVSRAVKRRAERMRQAIEPTCHVVALRRELHEHEPHTGPGTVVDWAHRWIVRGHWRRQFFPSRGTNAPMWIHPHVKGPTDKPFADDKPVVFAVRR